MIFGRRYPGSYSSHKFRRKSSLIDRHFQMRYTLVLIGGATAGLIVLLSPVFYFLHSNYKIFVEFAYETSPYLVEYLEREELWISIFLSATVLALIVFFTIIGFRFTNKIVGPINVLKNHLTELSHGNWHGPPIKVREDDEFQELIEVYNYFYQAYRTQINKDLDQLKKLSIDNRDIKSVRLWESMINEKIQQLQLPQESPVPCPVILISEGVVPSHDSRHVS